MNKNRMILAATGGVIALAVLAAGYFVWSAYADKTAAIEGDEENDGLETVVSRVQTLSRKPVYPCAESVKAIEAKITQLEDWESEVKKLVSRGDRAYEKTTPAAFKAFIVADAKRLAALPGAVNGTLVKPAFDFGPFKDYIAEGKMPADDKLAELQRQWDDVVGVVEALAKSGIAELTGIEIKDRTAVPAAEANAKQAKKTVKKPLQKGATAKKSLEEQTKVCSYVFSFTTRAPGFVKAINALSTGERFVVVDKFTFNRGADVIATALGGESKKESAQNTGRRNRRRRGAAAAAEEKAEEAAVKSGIVTDPVLDAPFAVALSLSVYDFRSLEDEPAEAEAADQKKEKGAAK